MYRNQQTIIFDSDDPHVTRAGFTRASLFEALDDRFTFADETTRQFLHSVYWRTVLPKTRPPQGAFIRRWMTPGHGTKYHGWKHNTGHPGAAHEGDARMGQGKMNIEH